MNMTMNTNKSKIINLLIIFILSLLFTSTTYSFPLKFSEAPTVNSYLHEDFYKIIVPNFTEVSEEAVFKVMNYSQIYTPTTDVFITDIEGSSKGLKIPYKFFIPNPTLSSHIFLISKGKNFHEVNIIFYETTSKVTKIYSKKGFIPSNIINLNTDYNKPFWLYGTISLIYADATPYSNIDILQNTQNERVASLTFIPESKHSLDLSNIDTYPYLYVINKSNEKTFLLSDRRLLNYFHKYHLEVQDNFYDYKGGAIAFKGFIYIENININKIDNITRINVSSSPVLFITEHDLNRKQVFTYQKSPYSSLKLGENEKS